VSQLLEPHGTIVGYDATQKSPYPRSELAECEFAVVCVGTPEAPDGTCDLSHVHDAVRELPVERILIRSTVPPGTTDQLVASTGKRICFSPEYVGENQQFEPSWPGGPHDVPFLILGGEPEIRRYFIDRFVQILGPEKTYFQTTALEAELVKYMENAFLATKVTFVNEFFEMCAAMGADWHTVREAWLLDPRIGRSHTAVFEDNRGFSGRCLPKDLKAIVRSAESAGYRPELLLEVLRSNARFLQQTVEN
jgi:nucleotide sugar dehydrogenase